MIGKLIASTFMLNGVLGSGWAGTMAKGKKDLGVLGGLIAKANAERKNLADGADKGARFDYLKKLSAGLGDVNTKWHDVKKSGGEMFGFFAKGAGIASMLGGSLFALGASTASYAEATDATAKSLGLGIGALQEFRYSAGLAEISANDFDSGMEKLNLALGKSLTENAGIGADALARLGLDMNAMLAMPVEERVGVIADGMAKITDATERATIASQLFGKGQGAKIGTWLAQGRGSIDKDRAESRATGGNVDDSAAAQAEKFNRSLDKLKATGLGIWRTLGIQVLPAIGGILEDITGFLKSNRAAFSSGFSTLFTAASAALGPIKAIASGVFGFLAILGKSPGILNLVVYGLLAFGGAIALLKIGAFAKDLYNLGKAVSLFAKTNGIAATAQWALNGAMTANPVGIVLVGIGALIAGVVLVVKYWDKITGAFTSFNSWLDEHPIFDGILRVIFPLLGVIRILRRNWDEVKAACAGLWDFLKLAWAWTPIGIVTSNWGAITGFFSGFWDGIASFASSAWDILKSFFAWSPLGIVIKVYGAMFTWLEEKFKIFSKIGGAFQWAAGKLGFGKDEADTTAASNQANPSATPTPVQQQQALIAREKTNTEKATKAADSKAAAQNNTRTSTIQNTITVNAAPGQSTEDLVRELLRKMEEHNQQAAEATLGDLAHA